VATTYYNIVFMKKAIEIQDSVIAFLNDNRNIVESKLKNGDAIKVDLLNIQAQVDMKSTEKWIYKTLCKNKLIYSSMKQEDTITKGTAFDFDLNVKQPIRRTYRGTSK